MLFRSRASSTYGQICAALAPSIGARADQPYQKVAVSELAHMQDQFNDLFGPGNKRILLRALQLYGEFAALGLTFSNERMLTEGVPLTTPFEQYAALCARTTEDLSVFEQMKYDFRGARSGESGATITTASPSDAIPYAPAAMAC